MQLNAPAVYIRDTGTPKGRGAFAARGFAQGETVETCPVILFHAKVASIPIEVRRVLFDWGVLASTGVAQALALGFGSLYNHDNPACLRYVADPVARTMSFIAVRDIAQDEELTINYNARGGGHESETDTWFSGMGVDLWKPYPPDAA